MAVVLAAPVDHVYPIEFKPEHESIAWRAWTDAAERRCTARAWIGRRGEPPIASVFAVALDEEVAPTAEGETPLYGLPAGTYDVHFEGDGCWWVFSLVSR